MEAIMVGTKTKTHAPSSRPERHDRLLKELDHDPYHSKVKLKEPTRCPECGAVFARGRWSWGDAPADARAHSCPACQRIKDRVPAAFLSVRGDFFAAHRDEILHLIENYEQRERMEHPLKRIMDRESIDDGVMISFTDAHLARGIGKALHDAYEGDVEFQYAKEDIMLRVDWVR
jgi:NMD protein affecting ribosome stability and mRNA decay